MAEQESTNYLRQHSSSVEHIWGHLGVLLTSKLLQHTRNSSNGPKQSRMMRSEWQTHLLTFFYLPIFYNLINNQQVGQTPQFLLLPPTAKKLLYRKLWVLRSSEISGELGPKYKTGAPLPCGCWCFHGTCVSRSVGTMGVSILRFCWPQKTQCSFSSVQYVHGSKALSSCSVQLNSCKFCL